MKQALKTAEERRLAQLRAERMEAERRGRAANARRRQRRDERAAALRKSVVSPPPALDWASWPPLQPTVRAEALATAAAKKARALAMAPAKARARARATAPTQPLSSAISSTSIPLASLTCLLEANPDLHLHDLSATAVVQSPLSYVHSSGRDRLCWWRTCCGQVRQTRAVSHT